MSVRLDEIVRRARDLSAAWIDANAKGGSARCTNADRVVELCVELVTTRPPQRPTAARVAEGGRSRFGSFPALQTLYNHYSGMLRIWNAACEEAIDVTAPRRRKANEPLAFSPSELASMPTDYRVRVELLLAIFKEREAAIARKDYLIRTGIPVALTTPSSVLAIASTHQVKPLEALMARIEGGQTPLQLTAQGIITTRLARPGTVVMEPDVVDAIRSIIGKGPIINGEATTEISAKPKDLL